MPTTNQNISCYQGESLTINLAVVDDGGSPVNITGYLITWDVALNSLGNEFISKTTLGPSGITITSTVSGLCSISLSASDTRSYAGTFYHEGRATDPSGNSLVITNGIFNILPSITK